MDDLLLDIERALTNKVWFLALFGCMTIPDICSALQADNGRTDGASYRAWFDENVAARYAGPGSAAPVLTGADCYAFRNALLHEGTTQQPKSQYSRLIFIDPDAPMTFHRNVMGDILNLDLRIFCQDMIDAAREWQTRMQGSAVYERNSKRFIRRHPEGVPPAVVGIAVYG